VKESRDGKNIIGKKTSPRAAKELYQGVKAGKDSNGV